MRERELTRKAAEEPVPRPEENTCLTWIYRCPDSLEGILTGVYDAWASRHGHAHVRLALNRTENMELFCEYAEVAEDAEKAEKVARSVRRKISPRAWYMVCRAAASAEASKADDIYRFLVAGFHFGPSVTGMLARPEVMRMRDICRAVGNEAHFFREFLRFDSVGEDPGKILFARIRPKNDILAILTPHFADRLSGENFLILDVGRGMASVHPADREWFLRQLPQEEAERLLSEGPDPYRDLWKTFYHAIAVSERINPKLQMNRMPLHYREFMTEFRD